MQMGDTKPNLQHDSTLIAHYLL